MIQEKYITKIQNCIDCKELMPQDCTVIAAVSGGADSLAMLMLLIEYFSGNGLDMSRLICGHFNHMIRGEDADKDQYFVQSFCKDKGIACYVGSCDIPLIARKEHIGIEEAARNKRYEFLHSLAKSDPYVIATAHTVNDRIETIIHNISRGSALEGLKGIAYKRDNIIRPILDFTRKETEMICSEGGYEARIDKTNYDTIYRRNMIRHEVLPFLRDKLGQDIDRQLIKLSDSATIDQDYFNDIVREEYCKNVFSDGKVQSIEIKEYCKLHKAVGYRLLRYMAGEVTDSNGKNVFPGYNGIDGKMLEQMDAFIKNAQSGTYINLPGKCIFKRDYDKILLLHRERDVNDFIEKTEILALDGIKENDDIHADIKEMSFFDLKLLKDHPCKMEFFDYDELIALMSCKDQPVLIRPKSQEDRIIPFGSHSGKTLNRFFIDNKYNGEERDNALVIALGNDVLWILTYNGVKWRSRRSAIAPVTEKTKNVLVLEVIKDSDPKRSLL